MSGNTQSSLNGEPRRVPINYSNGRIHPMNISPAFTRGFAFFRVRSGGSITGSDNSSRPPCDTRHFIRTMHILREGQQSMLAIFIVVLMSTLLLPGLSWAHGGGLCGFDCHHDRKQGGYPCYRGPLAGKIFTSQHEMMAALKALQAKKNNPPSVPVVSPSLREKTLH